MQTLFWGRLGRRRAQLHTGLDWCVYTPSSRTKAMGVAMDDPEGSCYMWQLLRVIPLIPGDLRMALEATSTCLDVLVVHKRRGLVVLVLWP